MTSIEVDAVTNMTSDFVPSGFPIGSTYVEAVFINQSSTVDGGVCQILPGFPI